MRLRIAIAVATLVAFAGPSAGTAGAETRATALAEGNTIYNLFAEVPSNVEGFPVTGLLPGETVVGVDYRPADDRLYALAVNGTSAHLYTLIPNTGVATEAGAAVTVASIAGATAFGIDFTPVSDRLRVVANNGANFRLTPTGTLAAADSSLNFDGLPGGSASNGSVVGIAYDRNFKGAAATTLFDVLSTGDRLAIQGGANGTTPSPNTGILANVGPLGVDTSENAALDIGGTKETAYAILHVSGVSGLYTVDLGTGAATLVGKIGTGMIDFEGLAVELPPVPPPPPPSATGGSNPPQVALDPIVLRSLTIKPSLFRAAAKGGAVLSKAKPPVGATVVYELSGAATVQFSVERLIPGREVNEACVGPVRDRRRSKPCTLALPKGRFAHAGAAGANSFRFTGRRRSRVLTPRFRRLAPGRYRLVASVGESVQHARFRISP